MINLYKALLKVQDEIGSIAKDSKNPFFKSSYLSLNGVRDAILPVLSKHGIVLNQPTVYQDGKSFISTELAHAESGEKLVSLTEVVCSKPGDAQNFGSGMSYSRRYGLMSILCLAAEDDDGNNAVGRTSSFVKAAPPTASTTVSVFKEAITTVLDVETAPVTAVSIEKKRVTFSKKPLPVAAVVETTSDDI